MKFKVYAVRDRQIDAFGMPMFQVSHGQAIRAFSDEVNREAKDNQWFMHPEDFDLYFLGEYEADKGRFECESPEQIAIGKNVKRE